MLILGLGIGANAATLSVVNAFLWRPISVPHPEQLVTIRAKSKEGLARLTPLPAIAALGQSDLPIDGLCGYSSGQAAIEANGQPAQTSFMMVTGECFGMFRIQPQLGRHLTTADAPLQGTGGAVAVIGYDFWQSMFGGDPGVIGRPLRIETTTMTIVGVMPADFAGFNKDLRAAFAIPFNSYRPASGAAYLIGRLRAPATLEQAEPQLRTIWAASIAPSLPATLPADQRRAAVETVPELSAGAAGISSLRNLYASTFVNIAALTGLLTLLTSINVGGLLCSRLASRLTELAIMRGLGATRAAIVRTMLLEALVLAVGGCAVGVALAYAAAPAFLQLLPVGNLPWTISLAPDARVLAAAAGIALVVALVIAAVPAGLATRATTLARTSDRTTSRATSRSAQALLVLQVAATLVVVFGCSLMVRSLVALENADRGYGEHAVLSMRLTATPGGYAGLNQPAYYPDLLRRVAALPGIEAAGMARYFGTVPDEKGWYAPVSWSGQSEAATTAIHDFASPAFFSTVGVPLLRGRDFTWADGPEAASVVIVSDSLARALDPSGDVVGRHLRYGTEAARQKLLIVGVAGNVSFGNSRVRDLRTVYFPGIQAGQATFGTLHLRTSRDLGSVHDDVRRLLATLGREQIVVASTIDGMFDNWLVAERMGATVGSAVTMLALCIACAGVFALLAYAVARRTRELGIRMAVGATRRDVSHLVLRDALRLTGAGVLLGIPAALLSANALQALMFGVTTSDLPTLAAAAALLMVIALAAALVPARRAVSVNPIVALKVE